VKRESIENSTGCRSGREGILVIAPNWLGDAVMATPFLISLRKYFPGLSIYLLCRNYVSEIFARNSAVDHLVIYEGRNPFKIMKLLRSVRPNMGWRFSFILPNSFFSALISFLSGSRRRIGYASEMRQILLTDILKGGQRRDIHMSDVYMKLLDDITEMDREDIPMPVVVPPYNWQETVREVVGEGKFMVVSPGATYGEAKKWAIDGFKEVAYDMARKKGYRIVVVGKDDEYEIIARRFRIDGLDVLNLAGKTDVRGLLCIIRGASFVVGNDSGVVHISSAMGIPTVAIFGSTSPIWTSPRGPYVGIVYRGLECSPCFRRECPKGEAKCLTEISAGDVLNVAYELLEDKGRTNDKE